MTLCVPRLNIHREAAHAAIRVATDKADELGVSVSISVVDRGGVEIAFLHMQDASLYSTDVARDKAYMDG